MPFIDKELQQLSQLILQRAAQQQVRPAPTSVPASVGMPSVTDRLKESIRKSAQLPKV